MDDLVTWLRAQLDDDEQMLRALDSTALNGIDSTAGWGARAYIERGLAEVDAKRRILDDVVDEASGLDAQVDGEFRVGRRDTKAEPYLGDVLVRLLAAPYADRPGYREEWRP